MSQDQLMRSSLSGAARQSAHPRLHALSKPYSRPSSFSGLSSSATMTDLANVSSSLSLNSPMKSPTKSSATTTRPGLSSSSSYGSLPRSGSDSSLFSGIKSIFSRPLQWLATPSRDSLSGNGTSNGGQKRDSLSSFGNDLENPDISPSERRNEKRLRRNSPSPEKQISQSRKISNSNYRKDFSSSTTFTSDYEPELSIPPKFEIQGRAVSGFMLPPLSPNVTLKPKSHLPQHINNEKINRTNFSRPLGGSSGSGGLSSSKSMSYLDPPSDLLGGNTSSPRKGGMLTRSKRIELSSLVDDDDMSNDIANKGKGKEGEGNWSPWKSRYSTSGGAASTAANARPTTPSRKTPARLESRDFTLPSASPFKPPPSPLNRQSPQISNAAASTSGLTRSATTANIRRATSVTSDVSMGGGLGRSGSTRGLRQSGSMLFGSVNGDRDRERDEDRMSIDGEHRQREGSVLDWFMKDRWDGRPGSPASIAASRRLGSAGPSLSHAPIRKGQLVWHEEDKAFVRESELRASQAAPAIHKNEAERILYTLESMRKTPLTDARKGELPPLIGQSSRTMRKTINVPLATAAAGDSAKQRRDKERLGGDDRLSVMISPYGRRKVSDQQAREERRSKATQDREYLPSPTPTASDARSDTRSQVSDYDMDARSSQKSVSPSPAPTPRRSSRLKRGTTGEEDAPTPKPTRKSKRGTSKQPETVHEDEQPQPTPKGRRSKKMVERGTSPTPPPPIPSSSVPTITATAPSPGGQANAQTASSGYKPLADGERNTNGSSLRQRSDVSKRTHVGAANYSRSVTPSSGRFSAKEEDLPDMDELEQSKIPLPSFSGISFSGLNTTPVSTSNGSSSSITDAASSASQTLSAQPSSSLAPPGRRPGGPLARVGLSSTRPRASSPLAAGSIVALPESPPSAPKSSKAAEPVQPPANGFFTLNGSAPTVPTTGSTTPAGKPPASSFFSAPTSSTTTNGDLNKDKSFSFGLGKPSTKPAEVEKEATPASGIPDFFGKKSAPPSGTTTPTAVPAFDFGIPKTTAPEPKGAPVELPSTGFSFGKPAETAPKPATNGGFSFGAPKEAEKKDSSAPAFSFGSSKPAEPAKATFSFGSTDKPAEPTKSTFSFGTPSTTATPAEPAKSTFSFGAPADKPAEAAKPAFSFGASSSEPAKATEPAKPAFSFGTSSSTISKPAEPAKPAFSFGAGSTTPAATPASGGFNFGQPAEKKDTAPSNPFANSTNAASGSTNSSFTFGASSGTNTSSPFGSSQTNGDTAKSNPFGGASTTPAPASTGFNFGSSSSSTKPNGTSSGFGASASAPASNPFGGFGTSSPATTSPALAPASNPFGQPAQASSSPATSAATSFGFGQSSTTPAAAPTSNPFGQQPNNSAAGGGFNFSFGSGSGNTSSPAPAPASGGFTFGQPANITPSTPSATNNSSFTFGAPAPSTPGVGQSTFSFGGSTTTPAAAPPASGGFSFGAPPAQQQQQQQRFGSPAPADGGFSLGANDGGVPGSPGGRKVKGLPRRGAVKR
ncbi:uncharacterized protein L201_007195 [Kwoniella dendrophila CBS 6074]|uniref:Uncharacterized protein n=1 Tax=Kwoniella dendrophila CBS 6074 TaxID=1295534 RepID=A0AAX4K3S3_9TREE